ncbi:hypothetical protein [Geotalea sp. SG265]|uniref:hypothetical protein n=1 Tax=Geotalea sp. SG265 TaxID=2922867 RepID=UPI001FB00C1A|nr:hypothetical protein [Geotalea sp. SG265]
MVTENAKQQLEPVAMFKFSNCEKENEITLSLRDEEDMLVFFAILVGDGYTSWSYDPAAINSMFSDDFAARRGEGRYQVKILGNSLEEKSDRIKKICSFLQKKGYLTEVGKRAA